MHHEQWTVCRLWFIVPSPFSLLPSPFSLLFPPISLSPHLRVSPSTYLFLLIPCCRNSPRLLSETLFTREYSLFFFSFLNSCGWDGSRETALSGLIKLMEALLKSFEGKLSVQCLWSIFGGYHRETGREMLQAYSCLRLVLPLTPRTSGPVGLNNGLLLEDIKIRNEFHHP